MFSSLPVLNRRTFLKGMGLAGAAGLLSACSGASSTAGSAAPARSAASSVPAEAVDTTPLTEFVTWRNASAEIECWNPLYSQKSADLDVLTNLWDGLLSFDPHGRVVPAIAKSWEHSADASVWTFHLRDDVDWVDQNGEVQAHLTSTDFLTGLEWVLNAEKNQSANTSMPIETLAGAAEYYAHTKELGENAAALTYEDMLAFGVGAEAPDDTTLLFTCTAPCPYFDTVAAYNGFSPAAPALIEALGLEGFRGCDYSNLWYCGPYLLEEFVQGNTKSYIPNPHYYDTSASRFERFTVTMLSDGGVAMQLYRNRELDELDLGESSLALLQNDPDNGYNTQLCEKRPTKFSHSIHFNFQKLDADGKPDDNWNKAIANRAFRQCFYNGLDLTAWYSRTNRIHPLKCENDCYTMQGLCYTSDGTDYTDLVRAELGLAEKAYDGKTMIRLRDSGLASLKKQAMAELDSIGVSFPVHAAYYIPSGSSSSLDTATVLKQCFADSFGEDFLVLDIETYASSLRKEVITPQLQSFIINGWGADYGDPVNFLAQETLHDDNAAYSVLYTNMATIVESTPASWQSTLVGDFEQFTKLVNEARAIVDDMDARYAAFAKAEAYLIQNGLACPARYDITWCLTHANEYSKINAMYGSCNAKAVNWETSTEGYTTAQYEQFARDFAAAASAN